MSKSIYDKRYLTSKQAQAAADKAGLAEGSYEIIQDPAKIGGATWMVKEIIHPEMQAALQGARQALEAAIRELQEAIPAAKSAESIQLLYDRLNNMAGAFEMSEAVIAALDEALGHRAAEIEADEQITRAQVASAPGNKEGWVHASTVLKPTKLVWAIADELYAQAAAQGKPMPTRKEVQEECVRRGIASGTARTQFQHWFKMRNDSAAEPRAQIIDGKIVKA